MTKTITLLLVATLFLKVTVGQNKKNYFKIEGIVQGYSTGTKLCLYDLSDGSYKQIDSTIIQNGKFSFRGHIITKFLKSSISTKDFSDRVSFWIEGGVTTISAEKGNFSKAKIQGAKIQDDQNKFNSTIDTTRNRKVTEYLFVKNNPTSIVSAHILSVYCSTWDKDTVSNLYNSFTKEIKSSTYAKKIFAFTTLNRNLKIGDTFVDFTQKDIANKAIKLSNFNGNVILLEFWGSWCGPCREQNPELVKIYNDNKSKGFEIFGVATETDKNKWVEAIKKDGLNWTNVTDLNGDSNNAALIYGVSGYPTNFLIDRNGIIVAKEVYGDELRNWLLKIL